MAISAGTCVRAALHYALTWPPSGRRRRAFDQRIKYLRMRGLYYAHDRAWLQARPPSNARCISWTALGVCVASSRPHAGGERGGDAAAARARSNSASGDCTNVAVGPVGDKIGYSKAGRIVVLATQRRHARQVEDDVFMACGAHCLTRTPRQRRPARDHAEGADRPRTQLLREPRRFAVRVGGPSRRADLEAGVGRQAEGRAGGRCHRYTMAAPPHVAKVGGRD